MECVLTGDARAEVRKRSPGLTRGCKEVVKFNGTLVNESILYGETNAVKTVEGKVNQRTVWVRVEAVDPKVTAVVVQTRTPGGGSDLPLAHEIEKQIALKLR